MCVCCWYRLAKMGGIGSDHVDLVQLGKDQTAIYEAMLDKGMPHRVELNSSQWSIRFRPPIFTYAAWGVRVEELVKSR